MSRPLDRLIAMLLGALALSGCAARGGSGRGWSGGVSEPDRLRAGDRLRRSGLLADAQAEYEAARERQLDAGGRWAALGLHAVAEEQGLVLDSRRTLQEGEDPFLRAAVQVGREDARLDALAECAEPWRSLGEGIVALEGADLGTARRAFERAVSIDPGWSTPLVGLGRTHLSQGSLATAEEYFRRAAWAAPEDPSPWLGLSAIADRRGDLRGALVAALEAWERAPASDDLITRVHAIALRTASAEVQRRVGRRLVGRAGSPLGLGRRGRAETLLRGGDLLERAGLSGEAATARAAAEEVGVARGEIEALAGADCPEALADFVREFVRGVQGRYRHYATTREAEGFAEFVAWARSVYERTTGERLAGEAQVRSWALIGSLVDPTEESADPLVQACARHGLLLVLGERAGGPPEALMSRIARRESRRAVTVRGVTVEREVVWVDHVYLPGYQEWAGGGDLAGLALDRLLIIDLGAIAEWSGRNARETWAVEPQRQAVLAQRALPADDPEQVEDTADVYRRLMLVAGHDLAGEVLRHEEGHIVDAVQRLPVLSHPLQNIALAISRGFDARRIVAFLERNAQLTAIAEGPAPRAALATCCERIGGEDPHSVGYGEIVSGMVRIIADDPVRFPSIDPSRVIVQQLHRLEEEQVRTLAGELSRAWGLVP